jgi:hypothetical protein
MLAHLSQCDPIYFEVVWYFKKYFLMPENRKDYVIKIRCLNYRWLLKMPIYRLSQDFMKIKQEPLDDFYIF